MAGTLRFLVMTSFITPPFLGAVAWVLLAAPNSGLINVHFRLITGAGPYGRMVNIFTAEGIIFVMASYAFPYVFVLAANTLDRMPNDLEEASAILGGRRGFTMIGGKSGAPQLTPLGLWRWPALGLALFVVVVTVVLPNLVLIRASMLRTVFDSWSLETITWANVELVFGLTHTRTTLYDTLIIGLLAATGGTIFAVLIAYLVSRQAIGSWAFSPPRPPPCRVSCSASLCLSATPARRSSSTAPCGFFFLPSSPSKCPPPISNCKPPFAA